MRYSRLIRVCIVIILLCPAVKAFTQDRILGKIKTLSTAEIKFSRWSIGGETLDRDYANYHAYKSYLNGLGAKRIRLQGGWARCEKQKGQYDFLWLDSIVNDAIDRGVQPWLQLSYGNPIYDGGGDAALAGGIPKSTEALAAWDKWVIATVHHFKNRITEWEIWNEPDLSKKFFAKDFNPFFERTVALVKQEQAEARVIALGLASLSRIYYVDSLLMYLKEKSKLNYVSAISYHGYSPRPEDSYKHIEKLMEIVKKYSPEITLWQGENGAPSTVKGKSVGALTSEDWSETTQAKWDLRRMMGDMAYGIEVTNIFQISDMYYNANDHMAGLNSKGLLMARPDKTIERPKLAYYAFQHAASLFSGKVKRLYTHITSTDKDLWIFSFQRDKVKSPAIVMWFSETKPADKYEGKPLSFTIEGISMKDPVTVNLLTGEIMEISSHNVEKTQNGYQFKQILATDSPIVICSREWLPK